MSADYPNFPTRIPSRKKQIVRAAGIIFAILMVFVPLSSVGLAQASAFNADEKHQVQVTKEKLDAELAHAVAFGLDKTIVQKLAAEEQAILADEAAPTTDTFWHPLSIYHYHRQSLMLATVYNRLIDVEDQNLTYVRAIAQEKLSQTGKLLQQLQAAKVPVGAFLARYSTFQSRYEAATTPLEFQQLSSDLSSEEAQLLQLEQATIHTWAQAKLVAFHDLMSQAAQVGVDIKPFQSLYSNAGEIFAVTLTFEDYRLEASRVDASMVLAQIETAKTIARSQLSQFLTLINQAQQIGLDVAPYHGQYAAVEASFEAAQNAADYQAISLTLRAALVHIQAAIYNRQLANIATNQHLTGNRAEAQQAISVLELDLTVSAHTGIDVSKQQVQADALIGQLQAAKADTEIVRLTAEIIYLDQQVQLIMQQQMPDQVVTVSLGEQESRMYDHGKLVYSSPVTTGRPELPTVTGYFHIYAKISPFTFHSPWPKTSPYWYPDSTVNWWMPFYGGYGLHDAYWRSVYGPGSNLPHYDPSGEDLGTHGCVNFPYAAAKWLWEWTHVGTTVVVY